MNKKHTHILLFSSFLFLLSGSFLFAGEINYATIEEIKDDKVLIEYSSPEGDSFFTCSLDNYRCQNNGDNVPNIFPEIEDQDDYVNSPDGKYGILEDIDIEREGAPVYTLYRIGDGWKVKTSVIPYNKPTERITFSADSSFAYLFAENGEVARYDIKEEELVASELSQNVFPYRIISPSGRYLSSYNYTDEEHRIWDFDDEFNELTIPSEKPNFVEFAENEEWAAFVDDSEGFESLYILNLEEDGDEVEQVSDDKSTVVDYLFLNDDLYYIANSEEAPYEWNLYQYTPEENENEHIYSDVSYADYIARADNHIIFLSIDDRNTNLTAYNPENDNVRVFEPLEKSRHPGEIKRETVKINDNFGAYLTNSQSDKNEKLFIWLHGGPQRQTSPAYHSYLSYAAYDELLDRLVLSGANVLKLDYSGSWGYGKEFIDRLDENIGKIDTDDVLSAAENYTEDYENIYLIGNSYGGYLAARALAEKPDLFAGAVSINGVLDWTSLIERIPSSPFSRLFNGEPGEENEDLYAQASINERIENLKDENILLFYGEKDSTVPTWQTTEFYELAQKAGVDVMLTSFSDEDHILRNRSNLNNLCEEITDWANLNDGVCEN